MASQSIRSRVCYRCLSLFLAAVMCAMMVGCNLRMPRLRFPGRLYQQQLDASYHDPYADRDSGPPVVGGRPLQYTEPRSLPVKSQWYF